MSRPVPPVAKEAVYVVGLPVAVTIRPNGEVVAEVDLSEVVDGITEEYELDATAIRLLEEWRDGWDHRIVSFPKAPEHEAWREPCPCGAPILTWRTTLPDGDSEPHGHCLNASCSLSTY